MLYWQQFFSKEMPVHTERLLYVQAVLFDMEHFIIRIYFKTKEILPITSNMFKEFSKLVIEGSNLFSKKEANRNLIYPQRGDIINKMFLIIL